jgi:metal-sensitive transcriptional repressor
MGVDRAISSLGDEDTGGYIEAEDKGKLQNRLRRMKGQVRGVQKMIDEEAYCIGGLSHIGGTVSAMEKAGAGWTSSQLPASGLCELKDRRSAR